MNDLSGTQRVDALNELSREWVYYDYNQIIKTAHEALAISKKEKYNKGEGEAFINLGVFYSLSGLGDTSSRCFKLGILKLSSSEDSTALICARIEKAFYCQDNDLLSVLQKSNLYAASKADNALASFVLYKQGIYYSNNKNYIDAIACLDKAIIYYSQSKNAVRELDCLVKKAETYYKMKNLMLAYKTAIYALGLAKSYQLPYSELCCERFLYSFYYNSGNYKNALSCLVSISKIQDDIRKFELDIFDKERKKELTILQTQWSDSVNKIVSKTKIEQAKTQNDNHEQQDLFNPYMAAIIGLIVLLLIAVFPLWKNSKKIKQQAATIKHLELELLKQKNKENTSNNEGSNSNSNSAGCEEDERNTLITKAPSSTAISVKIPNGFFVCANQDYFTQKSLLWTNHNEAIKSDFVVFLNKTNRTPQEALEVELNGAFENNNHFFKHIFNAIAKDTDTSVEGGAFCLSDDMLLAVSGINIYLWVIRDTGKKGLKINGRQQLPKKFNTYASLYEIKYNSASSFTEIKNVQLEKGDKVYLTTTSCYHKMCECYLSDGTISEDYLFGLSALSREEQDISLSKIKDRLKEDVNFIFVGCMI